MCKCVNPSCLCSNIKAQQIPHKHADLIKAWADGAEIEQQSRITDGKWYEQKNPCWGTDTTYRIKPTPKPDVVKYVCIIRPQSAPIVHISSDQNWNATGTPSYTMSANTKLVFDGETGVLKSVSLITE